MQKICHLTTVHERYDGRIFQKECVSLAKSGYEVSLLCADNKPDEINQDVSIKSIKFQSRGRIHRILMAPRIMLKAAILMNAEIYHLHDPELLQIGLALKRKGKIIIYDSHEDYPLNISQKEWIPYFVRKIIATISSIYEKKILKKINGVISVTPQIIKKLKEKNTNTVLITNYPMLKNLKDEIIDVKKDKNICFAGNVSRDRLHHVIINALGKTEGVTYNIAGPEFENYIEELQKLPTWKNVIYHGVLSSSDVFKMYQTSMCGIVIENYSPLNYDKQGSLGVTKLFEYMMAGLPVICTDFLIWKEIIEENNCGICVNPNDTSTIAEAINFLVENPNMAKKMGKNGRQAVIEKYNWKSQEKILINFYENL